MAKAKGSCRGSHKRYYFDKVSGSCQIFFYGGCNGNQNNFAIKEECESKCRLHLKPETRTSSNLQIDEVHDPICALPSETGPCRAMKPRYYYNSQKQKCERFMYGGCKGNDNNFGTHRECVMKCGAKSRSINRSRTLFKGVQTPPQCVFNNQAFNLGDILRLPQDECTTCTCSTPPTLTCMTESCANFKIYGDTKGCEVIKAKGSCCPQKIRCPKPIVGDCPSVCTQMGFVKPQNALCQTISDECGCDRGFFCVEN